MSRAVCSVENRLRSSPYLAPHPSAMRRAIATLPSKASWLTGSGSYPKLASRSASEMQSTGADLPTPRGSNDTTANSSSSVLSFGARCGRKSRPEPPGPPGLVSTEPCLSSALPVKIRMTAMSNVSPLSALAQSCGTRTVPHSARMERGRSGLVSRASSRQSCQVMGVSESPGEGVGCGAGSPVQPAAPMTTDIRAAVNAARRRTAISSGPSGPTIPSGRETDRPVGAYNHHGEPASTSSTSNRSGRSSCSYVHDSGVRSGRQRRNCAVCRNRSPSIAS